MLKPNNYATQETDKPVKSNHQPDRSCFYQNVWLKHLMIHFEELNVAWRNIDIIHKLNSIEFTEFDNVSQNLYLPVHQRINKNYLCWKRNLHIIQY